MGAIKYWLPVAVYAIIIFLFSSVPGDDIPGLFTGQDVVFHIVEYAAFALLVVRAFKGHHPNVESYKRFAWVFVLCFLYAVSDEFHQAFVPGRHPSLYDLIYDGTGILFANIIYR